MTIKITKTGVGNEDESLLFEFRQNELPQYVEYSYDTKLALSQFINLQSSQINGTFLEPITITGRFFGTYNFENNWVSARERSQAVQRLQGRKIKLFFDNIKTICIIQKAKFKYYNDNKIEYEITFQPDDITNPIRATKTNSVILTNILKSNQENPSGLDGEITPLTKDLSLKTNPLEKNAFKIDQDELKRLEGEAKKPTLREVLKAPQPSFHQ